MNEATIWKFLKSQGMTDAGAAGMMGNIYAESALNPINLQNSYEKKLGYTDATYTAAVDSGKYTNFVRDSAGYGLCQWTYWSRKEALLAFCKAAGTSVGDLNSQLGFLMKELTAGYSGVLSVLRSTTSVREASDAVLLNFEKPASVGANATQKQREETCLKRAGYAQTYYDQFAKANTQKGGAMKYSDANKPLVCMQTQSTCYKGTRTMDVKGVLWHSTGAENPWLKRYVQPSDDDPNKAALLNLLGKNAYGNDWNHVYREAGLNCWVGKLADGSVTTVQTMPWNYRPWGCGVAYKNGPSCNTGWIQFEICEDNLKDESYFNAVYKEACEITAYLCKLYNIDPYGTVKVNGIAVPTILCHQDSYRLGMGGNHSDVYHWFDRYGKTMEDVRNDVAALLAGANINNEEDDDMDVARFKELWGEMRKELQDNDSNDYSAEARAWATSTGLIAGMGALPNGEPNYAWADMLTREQLVTVLYRFAKMMGKV